MLSSDHKDGDLYYFVHSFYVPLDSVKEGSGATLLSTTTYGQHQYASAIMLNNSPVQLATQFHPEKSGKLGLQLLDRFIKCTCFVKGSGVTAKQILALCLPPHQY